MRPAEIALPSDIANLLIVNRTGYTGNPFDSNDAVLITGQVTGEAQEASKTLIFFLQRYLGGSARFQTVVAGETLAGNSFNRGFPRPIPWETVEALCRRYQTDALVAVEVYDGEFNVSSRAQRDAAERPLLPDTQEDPYTVRRQSPYDYTVRAAGNVIFGFRVYYPDTKTILDEKIARHNETWDGTGPDPSSAAANLPPREQALGDLIHLAGAEYARRIAPLPVPVTRKYFGESSKVPAMAEGAKLAEEDRWLDAAAAWEAAISGAPEKEAGQLAYNVAIANEKLGRSEQAEIWAQKAYEEYGNSQARDYLASLGEEEKKDTLDVDTGGGIQLPGVNISK
jgi:hypothetical protein